MPQIDFRNGIYQGDIKDRLPHGHGFFFSVDLTFIIACWQQGKLNGPTIIIYPSGSIFYGSIGRNFQNEIAVIEMARDKLKAYFINKQDKSDIAVTFPVINKILKINSKSFEVVAEYPLSQQDHSEHFNQILDVLNASQMPQTAIRVIKYFEVNFKQQNNNYQSFTLTSTGEQIIFFGQHQQGLGIKLRPQSTFGKQRVIQVGLLTKENQLNMLGYKSHISIKQTKIQQGIFSLKQTINSYPLHSKRPSKCLSVFLNHLKRSLHFKDQYLDLSEIKSIKQLIIKLQSNSLFEIKRQNAHRILEDPINDDALLSQLQRSRRQRRDQRQKTQINQSRTALNTPGQINPLLYSREVINTIKQEINRSIDKKRLSNSRSNGHISSYVKHSSPKKIKAINQQSPNKEKISKIDSLQRQKQRNSGSISTTKSPPKKIDMVLDRQSSKMMESNKRVKYDNFQRIATRTKKSNERAEYQGKIRRKSPAPILKTPEKSKNQQSPRKKVGYINQLEREEQQKDKINKDKFTGARANIKHRISPEKRRKPVFTQNIFEER